MEAWLSRRAGAVRRLRVCLMTSHRHWGPYAYPILPGTLLAAALGTNANQLRVLIITLDAIALSIADLDAGLGQSPNLEEISLEFGEAPACWNDRGAVLVQTLSRLPALRSLIICTTNPIEPTLDNYPSVVELAALRSAQLTFLHLDIDTSLERTIRYGCLPALTDCRLGGCGEGEGVGVDVPASSFSGTPNLTALSAHRLGRIHLAPDCFAGLSFLTNLRLTDCGLLVVPPALAGVQRTLRHLDLSQNNNLRVEEIGHGTLLALSALERLDLSKGKTNIGQVWDIRSVQYLSRFLTEWQALRPGVTLPTLTLDTFYSGLL